MLVLAIKLPSTPFLHPASSVADFGAPACRLAQQWDQAGVLIRASCSK
ncbi:hypothetical protein O9Y36_002772 [Salmonella enterica]|nr:hypothetical protein [Salmonella enterica]